MGLTKTRVAVENTTDQARRVDLELIVDTGSILIWVSSTRLSDIGVKPLWQKDFRTIEGRTVRRRTGPVIIALDGSEGAAEVVFAEEGDAEVLGVTALEGLGYEVDPVTKRLHRTSLLALISRKSELLP
jgi:aspartyl protease family protein